MNCLLGSLGVQHLEKVCNSNMLTQVETFLRNLFICLLYHLFYHWIFVMIFIFGNVSIKISLKLDRSKAVRLCGIEI